MKNDQSTIRVNYLFNTVYQLLTIIMPIITGPYVARSLGVSEIGHYSHVTSVVNYFVLFANFGIYTYGRREIGARQREQKEYSEVFWNVFLAKVLIGTIAILLYTIFIFCIREYTTLYIIELLLILSQILDISWFFQGLENYRLTVMCQCIIRILQIIAIFAFVSTPNDINIYTFIMSFVSFLGNLLMFIFLPKYISSSKINFCEIKRTIFASAALFIPQIATSMYMLVDKTMIGIFFKDGVQGGLYEQATKIDQMGLYIVISLTAVIIPRLSLFYREKDKKALESFTNMAIKYIMFIGCPIAFGISGIGYNVIPWLFGNGYEGVSNILQITAFICLVMGITNYLGYGYLVATRQHRIYTLIVFIGTIINFIMNYILIPEHGAMGAAVASLASETCVLGIELILLFKELNLKEAFLGTTKYFCFAALMGLFVRCMSVSFEATLINSLFILLCGVALYIIPLLILKDSYVLKLFDTLKNKFRHKKNRKINS